MTPEEKKAIEAASDQRMACMEQQIHELLRTHVLIPRDTILAAETFLNLAFSAALNLTNGDAVKSRDILVERLNEVMPITEKLWRDLQKKSLTPPGDAAP